jgi:hypothetical protein
LEAEMAKIDDDQVREYYEKNKTGFQGARGAACRGCDAR